LSYEIELQNPFSGPFNRLNLILHHAVENGWVAVPQIIDENGQKIPLTKWSKHQTRMPTNLERADWARRLGSALAERWRRNFDWSD